MWGWHVPVVDGQTGGLGEGGTALHYMIVGRRWCVRQLRIEPRMLKY